MVEPAVVLCCNVRPPARAAFNVLLGALESETARRLGLGRVEVECAQTGAQMAEVAVRAAAQGRAAVLAWSFFSKDFPRAAGELAEVRRLAPGVVSLAIAGGVHASAEPAQTLAAGFDLVAIGEGERTLLDLLARLVRGDEPWGAPGTARWVEGRVARSPPGEPVDLDEYPPFAVSRDRFGAIELTRGCIWACSFCQTPFLHKARFRHRSVEKVAAAVRALRAAEHRDVRFLTPSALSYGSPDGSVNLDAIEALLSAVREAAGPAGRVWFGTFPSELRPEHVGPKVLAVLKRFVDNDNVIIGGQSGSLRVLEEHHRGHDVDCIERAVRLCLEAGFLPNVDFILGLPGETDGEAAMTLRLMRRLGGLGARVHVHTFVPLPGTPLKDAPAATLGQKTHVELDRLAAEGRAWGQWRRQEALARALASRRPGSRAGRS